VSRVRGIRDGIDLVADVGEGFGAYRAGADESIIPLLTSANIACGFHAGDPRTIDAAVRACLAHGVAVGAHPGFPDLVGFGRRAMQLTSDEIKTDAIYQIGALAAFARVHGGRLAHLSPHGRLGNLAVTDPHCAKGIADAVEAWDPELLVMTQPGALAEEAARRGIPVAVLGLPDRAYEDDGTLVPRAEPGAVLHDPEEIAKRAVRLAVDGTVESRSGQQVPVPCDTLLLHGDNSAAVRAAELVRAALKREGIWLRANPSRAAQRPTAAR
jgi:UPF0271 protein